jgi:GT2 family glycosyltransferase
VIPAWIPGLFMLFRSDAYRQVEGFDERFFMYGEDFDICARLRLAGWKLQIAEQLQARHDARRASHRSKRHLYWHVTSLLKVWSSAAFWRYWRLERAG